MFCGQMMLMPAYPCVMLMEGISPPESVTVSNTRGTVKPGTRVREAKGVVVMAMEPWYHAVVNWFSRSGRMVQFSDALLVYMMCACSEAATVGMGLEANSPKGLESRVLSML